MNPYKLFVNKFGKQGLFYLAYGAFFILFGIVSIIYRITDNKMEYIVVDISMLVLVIIWSAVGLFTSMMDKSMQASTEDMRVSYEEARDHYLEAVKESKDILEAAEQARDKYYAKLEEINNGRNETGRVKSSSKKLS